MSGLIGSSAIGWLISTILLVGLLAALGEFIKRPDLYNLQRNAAARKVRWAAYDREENTAYNNCRY